MQKVAVRPALVLAVGVLGLVACSSPQAGSALPTGGAPSSAGGGQPTSSASAAPPSSSAGTSAIEPCSLLGASEIAAYGPFDEPVKKSLAGARVCRYERKTITASDGILTISIDVRDAQGVSTVNDVGGGIVAGKVNGRKAVQASAPRGSACILALAVGDDSRVDVSVNADSVQIACDIAAKVADIVEPKLPKG